MNADLSAEASAKADEGQVGDSPRRHGERREEGATTDEH